MWITEQQTCEALTNQTTQNSGGGEDKKTCDAGA